MALGLWMKTLLLRGQQHNCHSVVMQLVVHLWANAAGFPAAAEVERQLSGLQARVRLYMRELALALHCCWI